MRHELLVSCAGISSAATSGLSDMIRALMIKQAPSFKRRAVHKLLRKSGYLLAHQTPHLLLRHAIGAAGATLNALPVTDQDRAA